MIRTVRVGGPAFLSEACTKVPAIVFTLRTEMVAVDGDTAVVRAVVREGDPLRQECTDLWLVRLDDHGRCSGSRSGRVPVSVATRTVIGGV
jgi:hypothetical protein